MPPLDDAARFPALAPETAGCVEVTTPTGSTSTTAAGVPGDGADYDGMAPDDQTLVTTVTVNAAKAIAAYVRQLRCGPGRFDALARRRRDGARRAPSSAARRCSSGAARCVSCHGGPRLTDGAFHNVGLRAGAWSRSRFTTSTIAAPPTGVAAALADPLSTCAARSATAIAGRCPPAATPALEGAFRTPTLRCTSPQPSFMHTGADDRRSIRWSRSSIAAAIAAGGYPGTSELHALGLDRARARRSGGVPGRAGRARAGAGAAGGAVRRLARAPSRARRVRRRPARARRDPRVAAAATAARRCRRAARCPTSRSIRPRSPDDVRPVSPAPAASTRRAFCDTFEGGPARGRPRRRAGSRALERRRAARPTTAPASTTPSASDRRCIGACRAGSLEHARAARRRRAGLRSDRDDPDAATLLTDDRRAELRPQRPTASASRSTSPAAPGRSSSTSI